MLLGNKDVNCQDYLFNHVNFKSSNMQEHVHILEFQKENSPVQLNVSIGYNPTTNYDAAIVMYKATVKASFNGRLRYTKIAEAANCTIIATIGKSESNSKIYKPKTVDDDFFLLAKKDWANATSPFYWIIKKIEGKFFYYLLYYLYVFFKKESAKCTGRTCS